MRIIPAYAGSTFPSLASTSARRDHPRIRGEHRLKRARGLVHEGSSPHTRGAPVVGIAEGVLVRIIPAYAGSTADPGRPQPPVGDHPRIRGEHWSEERIGGIPGGSSPHTRGAHVGERVENRPGRIIPAYAGSTLCETGASQTGGDHPRIRGEHGDLRALGVSDGGSSPHTRGALY